MLGSVLDVTRAFSVADHFPAKIDRLLALLSLLQVTPLTTLTASTCQEWRHGNELNCDLRILLYFCSVPLVISADH